MTIDSRRTQILKRTNWKNDFEYNVNIDNFYRYNQNIRSYYLLLVLSGFFLVLIVMSVYIVSMSSSGLYSLDCILIYLYNNLQRILYQIYDTITG